MNEDYPPHFIYTDENMKKLTFRQINDEFNNMLEYALGTSLCPKCGPVSLLSGDMGACVQQGILGFRQNGIVKKYFELSELDKEEEAMKLLLKNPDVIRDNFYWECQTCHTRFISKVVWEILGVDKK